MMWVPISSLSLAQGVSSTAMPEHHVGFGYQYRRLVPVETYSSPHCSVMHYSMVFTRNQRRTLGAFVEPGISIVGLNQNIAQPNVSLIFGFQLGPFLRFGTGSIVTFRPSHSPPLFPQWLVESTILLSIKAVTPPVKLSYVQKSHGLEQYQFTVGYTFVFHSSDSP
ncbi:MAG: hypothetical protein VX278_17860 [Myxococcota bacterium]|nr:hypothetical protein [Myxococcota bacterium]